MIYFNRNTRLFTVMNTINSTLNKINNSDTIKSVKSTALDINKSISTNVNKGVASLNKSTGLSNKSLLTLGTTAVGSIGGALTARSSAKASAQARGLKPGTVEYNEYVRNRTLAGGLGGAALGGLAGSAINSHNAQQQRIKDYNQWKGSREGVQFFRNQAKKGTQVLNNPNQRMELAKKYKQLKDSGKLPAGISNFNDYVVKQTGNRAYSY